MTRATGWSRFLSPWSFLPGLPLLLSLLFEVGCTECRTDGDCDDGVVCNGAERCLTGSCAAGTPPTCDDLIECTADSCDLETDACVHQPEDLDGDHFMAPGCGGDDCDDREPSVYPGADEICDGLDNDCNGVTEEDRDGDGHLDPGMCEDGDDCDDGDDQVFPGAREVCDLVDNNCLDGIDDEADTDGDGHLDPTCGGDDCDDEDPAIHPAAPEECNGQDDNCDGDPDEDFDCIRLELYECETECHSLGTVECNAHCELPGLPESCVPPSEVCNAYDDDCDGAVDNGFPCTFGDLVDCETSCGSTGVGLCTNQCEVPDEESCLAPDEECNGVDDDCDGTIDDGFPCLAGEEVPCTTICDTQGLGTCSEHCVLPLPQDCPFPSEVCNDLIDNDCDGDVDCLDRDCIMDFACGG